MARSAAGEPDAAAVNGGRAHRLPPDLEARIVALEAVSGRTKDFDARSWAWLVLLGVILPIALLIIGWWL